MSGSFSRGRGGRRLDPGPIRGGRGGGGGDDSGGPGVPGRQAPGSITDDQLSGARVSTEHIRFARQGFAFDDTANDVDVFSSSGWTRVAQSGALYLQLGSSEDPFVAYVWGSYSWENNDTGPFAGEAVIVLYQGADTDSDGISDDFTVYQRAINTYRNAIPADGRARAFAPFTQIVVPALEGVDWWVGMQNHVTSGTGPASGSQRHRSQTLMAYTCAFDPELDSGLVTDGTLE